MLCGRRSALKQWADLADDKERLDQHYKTTLIELKNTVQKKKVHSEEISTAYRHFTMEVARASENPRSGRNIPPPVLNDLEKKGEDFFLGHCSWSCIFMSCGAANPPVADREHGSLLLRASGLYYHQMLQAAKCSFDASTWDALQHCTSLAEWKPLLLIHDMILSVADKALETKLRAVRLRHLNLVYTLRDIEKQIRSKEQLDEGLHLIDFEQLKIENTNLNEKIEERNEDLQKLKKKITVTVQVGCGKLRLHDICNSVLENPVKRCQVYKCPRCLVHKLGSYV